MITSLLNVSFCGTSWYEPLNNIHDEFYANTSTGLESGINCICTFKNYFEWCLLLRALMVSHLEVYIFQVWDNFCWVGAAIDSTHRHQWEDEQLSPWLLSGHHPHLAATPWHPAGVCVCVCVCLFSPKKLRAHRNRFMSKGKTSHTSHCSLSVKNL